MITENIRSDRQLKASIGFSFDDWQKLSILFDQTHQDIYGISLEDKFKNLGKEPILKSSRQVVFFVLFQLKNSLTYDVLGAIFGTNASNAQRNFTIYLPLIRLVLDKLSVLPIRNFESADWEKTLQQEEEIFVDATEIPIQRPVDQDAQKQRYSGKKKTYAEMHDYIS